MNLPLDEEFWDYPLAGDYHYAEYDPKPPEVEDVSHIWSTVKPAEKTGSMGPSPYDDVPPLPKPKGLEPDTGGDWKFLDTLTTRTGSTGRGLEEDMTTKDGAWGGDGFDDEGVSYPTATGGLYAPAASIDRANALSKMQDTFTPSSYGDSVLPINNTLSSNPSGQGFTSEDYTRDLIPLEISNVGAPQVSWTTPLLSEGSSATSIEKVRSWWESIKSAFRMEAGKSSSKMVLLSRLLAIGLGLFLLQVLYRLFKSWRMWRAVKANHPRLTEMPYSRNLAVYFNTPNTRASRTKTFIARDGLTPCLFTRNPELVERVLTSPQHFELRPDRVALHQLIYGETINPSAMGLLRSAFSSPLLDISFLVNNSAQKFVRAWMTEFEKTRSGPVLLKLSDIHLLAANVAFDILFGAGYLPRQEKKRPTLVRRWCDISNNVHAFEKGSSILGSLYSLAPVRSGLWFRRNVFKQHKELAELMSDPSFMATSHPGVMQVISRLSGERPGSSRMVALAQHTFFNISEPLACVVAWSLHELLNAPEVRGLAIMEARENVEPILSFPQSRRLPHLVCYTEASRDKKPTSQYSPVDYANTLPSTIKDGYHPAGENFGRIQSTRTSQKDSVASSVHSVPKAGFPKPHEYMAAASTDAPATIEMDTDMRSPVNGRNVSETDSLMGLTSTPTPLEIQEDMDENAVDPDTLDFMEGEKPSQLKEKENKLGELPVSKACVMEAIRLWPPIPLIERVATSSFQIQDHTFGGTGPIEKGLVVKLDTFAILRSAELFGDSANVFLPFEHILQPESSNARANCDPATAILKFAFGNVSGPQHAIGGLSGPHNKPQTFRGCPGTINNTAIRSASCVLSTILSGFDLEFLPFGHVAKIEPSIGGVTHCLYPAHLALGLKPHGRMSPPAGLVI